MTFLAPWALAAGVTGALGMVLLHLVAWQRPAAYVLPTTRFIPDQRTVVSRAATRPRDVVLLVLRVLMLLAAAVAFARPVLTPREGTRATIVLVDRSRSADSADVSARLKQQLSADASAIAVDFDSSLSAGFVSARRRAVSLAENVDSVRLVLISPVARAEVDSATGWLRAQWPGGVKLDRASTRKDSVVRNRVAAQLDADDPLLPAVMPMIGSGTVASRLMRGAMSASDSAFARDGGTIVLWPEASGGRFAPRGLAVGDEVVVAVFAQRALPSSDHAVAHWATGEAAAVERPLGKGCVRDVGVGISHSGDLPLHAPFQRVVRALLSPCGSPSTPIPLDSVAVRALTGTSRNAATASALRGTNVPPTPLVKWLLGAALVLALLELFVRSRIAVEGAA